MEELSVSVVRKSLVRRVVMGNMPARWLWMNIICSLFTAGFLFIKFSFIFSLFVIPFALISYILLNKAFAYDEYLFSVYIRNFFIERQIYSTSRANYYQSIYKKGE